MILEVAKDWVVCQGTKLSPLMLDQKELFQTILEGGDVEQTQYVRMLRRRVASGEYKPLPIDVDEIIARRRAELAGPLPESPLTAVLRADGRFELQDGHHRACRMCMEHQPTIPVKVVEVAPLWTWLCDSLRGIYGREITYQGIEHPYFDRWEQMHAGRCDMLGQWLRSHRDAGDLQPGRPVLDLGCLSGRLAREAARARFMVAAYDTDPRALMIAGYLDLVFGTSVSYHLLDVVSQPSLPEREWHSEVVFAMSLLHHYLKAPDLVKRMVRNFGSRSKVLVLDLPSSADTFVRAPVRLDQLEEWYRALLPEHRVEDLGVMQNRKILAFWRRLEAGAAIGRR